MANIRVEISLIIKWITCTSIIVFIVLNDPVEGRSAEIVTATRTNSLTPVQLCRATCIRKYVPTSDNPENCTKINHCAMCFDHCGSLDAKPKAIFEQMCSNITCLQGCKQACAYFVCIDWKRHGFAVRPKSICDTINKINSH